MGEEFVGDDEALGVALFPPRIGEVHEDRARARIGEAGEGFAGVFGEDTGAASEPAFAYATSRRSILLSALAVTVTADTTIEAGSTRVRGTGPPMGENDLSALEGR